MKPRRRAKSGISCRSFSARGDSPARRCAQKEASDPATCRLEQADFFECLHRRKQKLRVAKVMMTATEKAEKKAGGGKAKTDHH